VNDRDLSNQIANLVAEEQRLQEDEHHDPARLREVEVMLDQLWDLLRQRRGREEFGQNPDEAKARDAETVEKYWQ
jgi:hypothetical protein